MKKVILFLVILQFGALSVLAVSGGIPVGDGDRHRFFIMGGTGYASSNPKGGLLEAGVEIRLFGNIHARLLFNNYFGRNVMKDNITVKHMNAVNLYAVYKLRVSETVNFRLKAGGHYTSVKATIDALGLTFDTSMSDIGFCGGPGFSMQLSNRFYIYIEAEVKHLLLEDPWTWVNGQVGVMYRLR